MQLRLSNELNRKVAATVVCVLLAMPTHGQIKQTLPEGQFACQALEQAYGIRPSIAAALAGEPDAFAKLKVHLDKLRTLFDGNQPPSLTRLEPSIRSVELSGKALLDRQKPMLTAQDNLRVVILESLALVSQAQAIADGETKARQVRTRVEAANGMVTLLDSIAGHAGRAVSREGSPEAAFDLGHDLNTFNALARALVDGDNQRKIPATGNAQQRAKVQRLIQDFAPVNASAGQFLFSLQEQAVAREAIGLLENAAGALVDGLQRDCYVPAMSLIPPK